MTDRPERVPVATNDAEHVTVIAAVHCLECERLWLEGSERWRTYLNAERPPQPLTYCPECARREFD